MYVLSLRTTPKGGYIVDRSEWDEFCGDWVRVNARAVSPRFRSREAARDFCITYTAEHPGHKRTPDGAPA